MTDFHPATKYMSAAALFVADERVLLVNPTYKPRWEVPGGLVEDGESPRSACVREVREELGLDLPVGRLLGLDYRVNERFGEGLHFLFDGGALDATAIAAIRLEPGELSAYRFAAPGELAALLPRNLARRVLRCLEAARTGATLYMEDGEPHA